MNVKGNRRKKQEAKLSIIDQQTLLSYCSLVVPNVGEIAEI